MAVKRIVSNIAVSDIAAAKKFYSEILGLEVVMDHGWIMTYGTADLAPLQVSFATEGGSGTPVPDLSIEVDNLMEVYYAMKESDFSITYDLTTEPWGVKRFYVQDPFGKIINILSHVDTEKE